MRLPALIERELESLGLPWEVRINKGHPLLFVAGRFVTPLGEKETGRATMNARASIRRAARGLCVSTLKGLPR